jgi:hypothetical protein
MGMGVIVPALAVILLPHQAGKYVVFYEAGTHVVQLERERVLFLHVAFAVYFNKYGNVTMELI